MNLFHFLQESVTYRLTRLSIILFCLLPVAAILLVRSYIRARKHRKNLRLLRSTQEMEILKARIETQEQTFCNISADLHDNIGQRLSLAYFLTTSLTDRGIDTGDIASILRKAIADLRDLSHSLSTNIIAAEGLEAAIKREIGLLNKGNRIKAEFFEPGERVQIDTDKATILYRVFQEAIQNVMKHANAQVVKTAISAELEGLHMTIADDGIGMEPGTVERNGFKNMRARLNLINGNLSIENSPVGTTLFIKIPLDK